MDFISQFVNIGLSRMLGGGADMKTDSMFNSYGSGDYLGAASYSSAIRDIPEIYNSIANADKSQSKEQQVQRGALAIGTAVGDIFTGGQVSRYRGLAQKYFPHQTRSLEKIDRTINPSYKWIADLLGKAGI